jgi:hypothetical protein
VVYEGPHARDCSIDEFGNLYFTTDTNEINITSYLDLWAGSKNTHSVICNRDSERIDSPRGLSVVESEDLWFVNGADVEVVGLLNHAEANTSSTNSHTIETKAIGEYGGYGCVANEDYVYFTSGSTVYAYDIDDEEVSTKNRALTDPRGIAWGDDDLYVVDRADGSVYRIEACDEDEEVAKSWVRITGAYGIFAVNFAASTFALIALLLY